MKIVDCLRWRRFTWWHRLIILVHQALLYCKGYYTIRDRLWKAPAFSDFWKSVLFSIDQIRHHLHGYAKSNNNLGSLIDASIIKSGLLEYDLRSNRCKFYVALEQMSFYFKMACGKQTYDLEMNANARFRHYTLLLRFWSDILVMLEKMIGTGRTSVSCVQSSVPNIIIYMCKGNDNMVHHVFALGKRLSTWIRFSGSSGK